MAEKKKSLIGEIIIDQGLITPEQLKKALAKQKETGELLGAVMVNLGYVSQDDVYRSLARQLGVEYRDSLEGVEIEPQLLYKIPYRFLEHNHLIPLEEKDGRIIVAMANPQDRELSSDLKRLLNCEITAVICSIEEIDKALRRCYGTGEESVERMIQDLSADELELLPHEVEELGDLMDMAKQAPIIKLVNLIMLQAIKERASDIHIEPFENDLVVRYRVDGVLYEASYPPKNLQAAIISRIKIMAELNIAERRMPQDGRIKLKIGNRNIDVRVSTIPTVFGESVVLRLLDKESMLLGLGELGMLPETCRQVEGLLESPHGIILVTGPTGSGKTTTLYAALSKINSPDKKIITIEDPVEYQLDRINQIHVNPKAGITFARGLRSILRQDPDVMMVGEVRDLETAEIAIQAALTGHLVFSTLHTNDAPSAITRLVDMGVEPYLVSSSVIAILAQRLVRVICGSCKKSFEADAGEMRKLGIDTTKKDARFKLFRGEGCEKCHQSGFLGRTGIYELMMLSEPIQKLIYERTPAYLIKKKARELGMRDLREDGWEKIRQGITTAEEVLRATEEEKE